MHLFLLVRQVRRSSVNEITKKLHGMFRRFLRNQILSSCAEWSFTVNENRLKSLNFEQKSLELVQCFQNVARIGFERHLLQLHWFSQFKLISRKTTH